MRIERLYIKTFTKIALTITLTAAVLSVVLFINFRNTNSSLIQYYTADQLYQIKHSTDMMLENARRTIMSYSANGDVLKLINNTDMDSLELFQTLRRVEALQHNRIQPEYICFYNQRTNSLYYQSKRYDAGEFPDEVLIDMLRGDQKYGNFYPILRKAPDYARLHPGSLAEENMYSFIYTNSPDGNMNNAVVLNIPVHNIDKSISASHTAISQEIIILNNDLKVIRGNDRFSYDSTITDEPAIAALMKERDTDGYTVDRVGGQKCLISYVESDVVSWKYLRITPYRVVSEEVFGILWKTVAITLAILLPLLFIGAIISRNIYRVFQRRLYELDQTYKEEKKSGFTARQRYLRKVLHGESVLDESGRSAYHIQLENRGPYTLLLLCINQYATYCRRYSQEDRDLFSYGFINIFDEILEPMGPCEVVDMGDGHFAALLGGKTADMTEPIRRMQEAVQGYVEISLSSVLSDPVPTAEDLPLAVSECREALHYRLYYDGKMHVHIRDIREIQQQAVDLPDSAVRQLTDTLMLGKRDELMEKCRETLGAMKGFSYSALKVSLIKIIMSVQEAISQKGFGSDIVRLDEWLAFVQDISDCPSMESIESRLHDLFGKVLKGMDSDNKIKDMRFARLFAEVHQILEAEYAVPHLTPEAIAERLHMSAEYFKKIYKSNTGMALSEEINQYRLKMAAAQIERTNQPIAEIAQNCGFSNVNYFYTLFKRKHGITAAEYRRLNGLETNPV